MSKFKILDGTFITANSGNGKYDVTIKCPTMKQRNDVHDLLINGIPDDTLKLIREFRVECWKNVMCFRGRASAHPHEADFNNKQADSWLVKVQALNFFFDTEAFDTAEKDLEHEQVTL